MVDLSVGTPVDPTPEVAQRALRATSDSPGYPTTWGTEPLRAAAAGWMARDLGVSVSSDAVLPTVGSKELVAWLPTLLGLGAGDTVVVPEVAYPTYDVGARIARCEVVRSDEPGTPGALRWLNSPSNPTGRVLSVEELRAQVRASRELGQVLVSDECYISLGWDAEPVSLLHPSVCDGSHDGLLVVHSLSKRSSMAGYRFGFIAGDPVLVRTLLEVRKHAGMIVPMPVQAAAQAALDDDVEALRQKDSYRRRRDILRPALESAGFRVDHSEAGLYLWCTRGEPCWDTVGWLAGRGILVAPGDFYGPASREHVRVALTATDERIAQAVTRLAAST